MDNKPGVSGRETSSMDFGAWPNILQIQNLEIRRSANFM